VLNFVCKKNQKIYKSVYIEIILNPFHSAVKLSVFHLAAETSSEFWVDKYVKYRHHKPAKPQTLTTTSNTSNQYSNGHDSK
jgi:hypothetical protein